MSVEPPAVRVEMVLDFVCVHSYIGFTRFLRAAQRYPGTVEISYAPYQLRPDASSDGEPLFEVHKREHGEETAREIAAGSYGREDGLRVNLGKALFTNTFDAHRLQAHAARQGAGERMAERLYRAYFSDGVNIADRATLSRLAAEVGVTFGDGGKAELRAELARVRRLGVESVPVFRFGDGRVLAGRQPEDALLDALRG